MFEARKQCAEFFSDLISKQKQLDIRVTSSGDLKHQYVEATIHHDTTKQAGQKMHLHCIANYRASFTTNILHNGGIGAFPTRIANPAESDDEAREEKR